MIISYSSHFVKQFKKITKEKQKLAEKQEKIFRKDPFDSRLKTHKLSGLLKGYWAFSLTYSDRVIFRFITQNEVIFYKIGSHDIYKSYA